MPLKWKIPTAHNIFVCRCQNWTSGHLSKFLSHPFHFATQQNNVTKRDFLSACSLFHCTVFTVKYVFSDDYLKALGQKKKCVSNVFLQTWSIFPSNDKHGAQNKLVVPGTFLHTFGYFVYFVYKYTKSLKLSN